MERQIFSKLGTNIQEVGKIRPDGYVKMSYKRPSINHKSQADGTWAEILPDIITATKLSIRRAMRELGIEDKLDNLLLDDTFKKDWFDAVEIDLTDDLVLQALNQGQIDVEQVKAKIREMS